MNKKPFLIVLGLALVFEGAQCQEREVFVALGSVAVLPCVDETSAVSHPTAVYWSRIVGNALKTVWRREKSGLEFRPVRNPPRANCPVPNFGKADYSLHIAEITFEDGGKYICEVEGKTRMTKLINLRVVKASLSPAVVVEGSRIEATCHVSPGTQSIKFNWKRNGSSASRMSRASISSVSQRDAGTWTCQVSYNGRVVEATTSLEVKGIIIPQDEFSVVYADVGSSVSLPCVFTDGLIPNTVIWNRTSTTSNAHVPLPASFEASAGPSASAAIQRVEDGDEGMYTCSGMMSGLNGERIKVQRKMELVVSRVLRSSSSSGNGPVTLTCNLSNSDQITSYEWLRVTYGPNDTQTVTSVQKTKSFRIQESTEKNAGEWVCRYYRNEELLGNATYHLLVMGAVKSENSSSGNKTALVMGLGFMFLVIFLILFQMYRNYRRKRKILLYPAMETIVHQAATEREQRES
ncbi:lymphocyte activation gene 3 protein-like [Labeo rohita]|uniref:Lymphocyte activation gene 3 protein-like n=1 Tax=Labeo rohita TaxID=84645 RepID=A0A498NNM5_LABRO|nr:lymphocyte activation gene 3 protein-like [Labeo rohita]